MKKKIDGAAAAAAVVVNMDRGNKNHRRYRRRYTAKLPQAGRFDQ